MRAEALKVTLRHLRYVGLLALVAGLVAATLPAGAAAPTFQVGVTHTQYSADEWRNPTAVARAKAVLKGSVRLQAQALMGWGANNPNPAPGSYDWASFDERMRLIASSGGTRRDPLLLARLDEGWHARCH